MPEQFDATVLVGRFQPFHNGHRVLLRRALEDSREVVVILGSAKHARSPKNPFTWSERARMIELAAGTDAARLHFVPVRDYFNNERWLRAVKQGVAQAVPQAKNIGVIGHFKDATSYYLDLFQGWTLIAAERHEEVDATHLRRTLFSGAPPAALLAAIEGHMPRGTVEFLRAWVELPYLKALTDEWQEIKRYRELWASAPFQPMFVTVDAVVRCSDQVLLIRRGRAPGQGLWAQPGGFVEQHELLLQAAIRELQEETRIGLLHATLQDAFRSVQVFDHPQRSLRGRTITHAHFFDLGHVERPPIVQAADDAAEAAWIPIGELPALEDRLYEDHYTILDHFLSLNGD